MLPREQDYFIKFAGTYELAFVPRGTVRVGGLELREGERVRLAAGRHRNGNDREFRLRLIPAGWTEPADGREEAGLFSRTLTY